MRKVLALKNIAVGYHSKGSDSILIKSFSASIQKGETIAILGLNGCGKTTLLKSIKGELPLLSGEVLLDEISFKSLSNPELAKKIASVSTYYQNPGQIIVEDLVGFGRYPFTGRLHQLQDEDKVQIKKAMDRVGINNLKDRFVDELSDGERQKVMLACAFAQNTPLLILDEPTSHLDVRNKVSMMNLIRQFASQDEKTILFSTHDLGLAKNVASRIWLIHDGKIVDESVTAFMSNKSWKPLLDGIDEEWINWL
jgi:iron complex transport system ATP-binding protein